MSDELKAFYRAYLAWLEAGAPQDAPFYRDYGLCSNMFIAIPDHEARRVARIAMREQFNVAKLSRILPFNANPLADDLPDYGDEAFTRRCHLNPKRIAWVREHAQ